MVTSNEDSLVGVKTSNSLPSTHISLRGELLNDTDKTR